MHRYMCICMFIHICFGVKVLRTIEAEVMKRAAFGRLSRTIDPLAYTS